MKTIVALVGGAVLTAYPFGSAVAQQTVGEGLSCSEAALYNVTSSSAASSPLSPSSATTTVSPSSVPQAMERMDKETVAEVSLGTLYAGGKFGTGSSTRIWSSALVARVRLGDWKLSASLPWMRIRSRSTIFTGIDATPVLVAPNTFSNKQTVDGFGDLTLGAAYTIAPTGSPVEVELSGRAKLNTATKRSGLSSGEADYAVGADVSVPMGRVTPFASFTYRFLGDTTVYQLRDGPAASAGASLSLGAHSFLLASYHYSRAATGLVTDAHELFAGASTQLAGTPMRVTGFVTKGVSNGAADASAGIALSYGLTGAR